VKRLRNTNLILAVILILAFSLRILGINWDDYTHIHPDERFLTSILSRIGHADNLTQNARERCQNEKLSYYFFNTNCSFFNPNNVDNGSFAYGTLPLFMVYGSAELTAQLNLGGFENPKDWMTYDYLQIVGRFMSALADIATTLFIYLIGRRLFSSKHGLLAACLYAFAVLPIQLAHFWTVDSFANLFFVVGLFASVEISFRDRFWPFGMFGLALGAAVASRVNLLPMAILVPTALLIEWQQITRDETQFRRRWLLSAALLTLITASIGLVTFRVFQPYAFVGPTFTNWNLNPKWIEDIGYVSQLSSTPSDGWPPSVQWFNRLHYVYPWFNMSVWGMGLVLGGTATVALLAAIIDQLRKRRLSPALGLLTVWVVVYFAFMGGLHQMTMRYYLPLYSALVLLVAWGVWSLPKRWGFRLMGLIIAGTVIWALAFTTIYLQPLTRVEASRWITEQVPATITLQDNMGDSLPTTVSQDAFRYPLQTAFKGESYLGKPFEVTENQQFRHFGITFTDPIVTQTTIQLLKELGDDQRNTVFEFSLNSDEQGHVRFDTGDFPNFPGIPPGVYRWHILNDWQVNRDFRYFMFVSTWETDGGLVDTTPEFLSPFEPVKYAIVSPESPLMFRASTEFTATRILIPHVMGAVGQMILQLDDGQIKANLVSTEHENQQLGSQLIYELEEPIQLKPNQQIQIISSDATYITGSAIVTEGSWDDSLPLAFCPRRDKGSLWQQLTNLYPLCDKTNPYASGYFNELPLNMAETDTEVKYRRMSDNLTKADYLVMSSNRFYDALPRVQRRFSMSDNFYNQLFAGNLGYDLLKEFSRSPNFLGVPLNDHVLPTSNSPIWLNELEAEEAFTVYDHPAVFVFKNRGFTADKLSSKLPSQRDERNRLNLRQLPAATFTYPSDSSQDTDSLNTLLLWAGGFFLLGWISMPLMYVLFPNLPLRGFTIGRGFSWLFLAFLAWWLDASLHVPSWTQAGLWVLVALWAGINVLIAVRKRNELLTYVKQHWRAFVLAELMFLVALSIGLMLRAVNPDLWHLARGGEKPMDFAYLNAVLRTSVFPPPNPWLAGFEINYYYFGFVLASVPIKLGNFIPAIGVNLVLATLYCIVFTNIFVLSWSVLVSAKRFLRISLALVGVVMVMLAGNLGTLQLLLDRDFHLAPNRWYWHPTRILGESSNGAGGAINEMPLFSFLFGDLHAHIVALLPVTLFLIISISLIRRCRLWLGLLLGCLAGLIYMSNTWDVLLYIPLGAFVMWLATGSVSRFIKLSIFVVLGGLITIAPFFLKFNLGGTSGFELWQEERSLVEPFLLVWGIPIGITTIWLIYRIKHTFFQWIRTPVEYGIIGPVIIALMVMPSQLATSVLCLVLISGGLILAFRDESDYRPIHLGISLVFAVLFLIEYVVVKGDVGRMNTVFKISFQVWIWLGLLIPLILMKLVNNRRYLDVALCLILIGFGLLYPITSIPARYDDNQTGDITLDGNHFMNTMVLNNKEGSIVTADDRALIEFMRSTINDFPVIAEWYETEYSWNSRIATQTGFSSVIGWRNHMRQQYPYQLDEIDKRIQDIQLLYTGNDIKQTDRIIANYDIQYIVVGELELSKSTPEALDNFETMLKQEKLKLIYQSTKTRLYQVIEPQQ
jgi:YYY domain-containing protein